MEEMFGQKLAQMMAIVHRAQRTYHSSTEPLQSKAGETVQDAWVVPNSERDYEDQRQQVDYG